ncbi:MAG: hypothetical protein HFE49_00840 [Clostridia bacterium]|nr:hypothetical protein [Clostridia bacterium]
MEKFVFPESMGYVHKTISVPRELCERVQKVLAGRKTSFGEFAVAAMDFTLKNMDEED